MKKIAIVYGEYRTGVQKKAVEVLTAYLLDYTMEYPLCIRYEEGADLSAYRCIHIGTRENHAYIRSLSEKQLCRGEEYSIRVWKDGAVIEGSDDNGVLYGCVDFYSRYIVRFEHPDTEPYWINPLEGDWPEYCHSAYPAAGQRGIWTWGHVIYDYKGFMDHMVRLKMNTLILWNDHPPVNAADMVAYAHDCGIRLIWGFAWYWDTHCETINIEKALASSGAILEKYEREYHPLGGDGIYFQSFTELSTEKIGDRLIAEAVTEFVNQTAAAFLEKYPDLEIQFGLHATSVREKLSYIRQVDPRIRILWEDCGAFPFAYMPCRVEDFEETCDFVGEISVLRGRDDRFGVVTKGLTKLDWPTFEHVQGQLCVGSSSKWMKENRLIRKRRIWRYLQAGWIRHADKAWEMIRLLQRCKEGDLVSVALVEDGMFEEKIMYPVAIYGEMLWDGQSDVQEIMHRVALRSDVEFA